MLKKVMEDGVLWGLAVGLHIVRTVKDTPTLNTGNVQLSMVEDSFPETTLNMIYDFLQPIQQFNLTILSVVAVLTGLSAQSCIRMWEEIRFIVDSTDLS